MKWWDWNKDKIVAALPLLLSGNVDDFIEGYYMFDKIVINSWRK